MAMEKPGYVLHQISWTRWHYNSQCMRIHSCSIGRKVQLEESDIPIEISRCSLFHDKLGLLLIRTTSLQLQRHNVAPHLRGTVPAAAFHLRLGSFSILTRLNLGSIRLEHLLIPLHPRMQRLLWRLRPLPLATHRRDEAACPLCLYAVDARSAAVTFDLSLATAQTREALEVVGLRPSRGVGHLQSAISPSVSLSFFRCCLGEATRRAPKSLECNEQGAEKKKREAVPPCFMFVKGSISLCLALRGSEEKICIFGPEPRIGSSVA